MKISTIHDLPRVDRPREKLIKYGPDKLTNPELLAIILKIGQKGYNVLDISKDFFKKFTTDEILNLDYKLLSNIKGIGSVKACEIIASVELGKRLISKKEIKMLLSPKDIWNESKDFRESNKEHFVIFFLNSRFQKIHKEIISIGTLTASLVHPREVFEPAVKNLASSIILVHNHPSGNINPSEADIQITKKLIKASEILDIEIVDHIVVTKESWYSFRENNLLKT